MERAPQTQVPIYVPTSVPEATIVNRKKQGDVPVLRMDRCISGTRSLRLHWKMTVRDTGLFCNCIPVI